MASSVSPSNDSPKTPKTPSTTPYDDAIKSIAKEATKHISPDAKNIVIGFGSGRAATAVAKEIAALAKYDKYNIVGVPTSLQIKLVIENVADDALPLIGADQTETIDIVFDGADQIDSRGYVIKGGGGALLRENILFNMAKKVVVMADASKFTKNLRRTVPVEVHQLARSLAWQRIVSMGGSPALRMQGSGYPAFTENGNIVLDCDFGVISDPKRLTAKIKQVPGVVESGIFAKRPDIIYKAHARGKFTEIATKTLR